MAMPARRRVRLTAALVSAVAAIAMATASAGAHPLGNFTINHYAGLRVQPSTIELDVVIDFAEIPTFEQHARIDTDGDGRVAADELDAERRQACPRLADDLELRVDGANVGLTAVSAGVSMPPGAGGLPTLRLVCQYVAALPAAIEDAVAVTFEDASFPERIGWREMVVAGDGTTISPDLPSTSVSGRLTTYPDNLLQAPLDVRVVAFTATPGGDRSAPRAALDATPIVGDRDASASAPGAPRVDPAAVPAGIDDEIGRLLAVKDLTPLAVLASLLVAFALGAVHALSPGHGKTVMAAYLVGSRGSVRHAVALGLTVTVSHTVGVLALALLTLFAAHMIPPERLYPILGLASGALVIAIGVCLLAGRVRALVLTRAAHRSAHDHRHDHSSGSGAAGAEADDDSHEHAHGPFRHRHGPLDRTVLTWRSLFTLGLAGGLVPSASALLLLLGSVSTNRAPYGIVLVLAFGAGMAVILGGLGVLLVRASRLLEHARPAGAWTRAWTWLPTATALVVVAAGVYMTGQAVATVF